MKLSDFISDTTIPSSGQRSSANGAKDLELVLDIIKKINSKLSLQEVLNNVLNYAIKITYSDRGFILLKNPVGDLKYEIGFDIAGKSIAKDDLRISTKVAQDVFATGLSRFIEGALGNKEFKKSRSIESLALQTILCSPLTVGNEVIGVIYVDSKTLKKISLKEITKTFEILAGQAAIAIRNAQLFESMCAEKEKAKEFNKLKTEFLDQVSHEIRTPLNVIMSFSQLIGEELENNLSPEIQDSLRSIRAAGGRIVRTIDLILKISELKSGTYTYKYSKVDLNRLVDDIVGSYIDKLYDKNIKVKKDNCNEQVVVGDIPSINQMLNNIIDNSVKFTKDGEIEILFYTKDDFRVIEVRDTGIGISKEFLPRVFDHFTQEETGYTRTYDGLGLGLTLVKHLAEINNCKVEVNSQKHKGTSVKLYFYNNVPNGMMIESLLA